MNIHEYQAKEIFSDYGITVPQGGSASTIEQALEVAQTLGGNSWMIKAQIHAGGRGKAGIIRHVHSHEAVESVAEELLGTAVVTEQSANQALPINTLLIEQAQIIAEELYIGLLVDREVEQVVMIVSPAGGMEIEEIASRHPEKILKIYIDNVQGLGQQQLDDAIDFLGLEVVLTPALEKVLGAAYQLFIEKDLSLLEINPLITTADGNVLALDGKLVVDDNALFRHQDMQRLYDASQIDEREHKAHELGLNYISLDGNIACMVNGAGLAMATMDLIKLHGGEPANFLDVGGGATAERVAGAFRLILTDDNVQAILVNIFGGIVRCDLIAEGIIQAVETVRETASVAIPVIVRLEGTNAAEGRKLLEDCDLDIISAQSLTAAAEKAVAVVLNTRVA